MANEVEQFELLQKSAVTIIAADLAAESEASRLAAQEAASTATTKANEAGESSVKASQWAENNEDVAVETGKFSAKHYSIKAAAQNAQMQEVYPLAAYRARVLADAGNIQDLNKLTELYIKNLQLLESTVGLFTGLAGMKTRTSGSNQFASKWYNMANKVQQFGAELVTNGTFTTDTSGWTGIRATLTVDTNRLKVLTSETSSSSYAYQLIPTIAGKTYHISGNFTDGDMSASLLVGSSVGASDLFSAYGISGAKTYSFVATGASAFISLRLNNPTSGQYAFFDNVSVKQMDWVDGTNDAVQTTEANQPYVGGTIAPNEVKKIKNIIDDKSILFQTNTVLDSTRDNGFSICTVVKPYYQTVGTSPLTGRLINGTNLVVYLLNNGEISFISTEYGTIRFAAPPNNKFTSTSKILHIKANSGGLIVSLDGVKLSPIIGTYTPFLPVLNGLLYQSTNPSADNTFAGEIYHHQVFNKYLSEAESQAVHDYLRLQIPEIEGVAIGNQYWATSNYEGVVAGDGTVIPEVKNSDNVDRITNGAFVGGLSPWVAGNANVVWQAGSGDGEVVINGAGTTNAVFQTVATIPAGAWVKLKYTVVSNTLNVPIFRTGAASSTEIISSAISLTSTVGSHERLIQATRSGTGVFLYVPSEVSSGSIIIDDVSFEVVGWSQSTALYDAVYAQTSGTTAQKELAALKAAAMWCYPNNSVDEGAIYGKILNGYAKNLLYLYPPQGYRGCTRADTQQLASYLSGASVAGAKMKAMYGLYNNSNSTNESGLSILPSQTRSADGSFPTPGNTLIWEDGLNRMQFFAATKELSLSATSSLANGFYIRLLRNAPVGPNERMETSGVFDTNIASTAKQVPISFGYTVDCIRITNLQPSGGTNLTSVEAKLHNASGTAIATLITGKTVNVASTMVYNISAEHAAMLQDGTVRVTATGNLAPGMIIEVVLKKATF